MCLCSPASNARHEDEGVAEELQKIVFPDEGYKKETEKIELVPRPEKVSGRGP